MRDSHLTVERGISPSGTLSDKGWLIGDAPIGGTCVEGVEGILVLDHPGVVVDCVERYACISPPIASAPFSAAAGPFKPGGSYSCQIASAGDGLINFPNESLNGREVSGALHSGAAGDHPLRLVEYFNCLNRILQTVLADEVKERDESIVEI